MSYGVVGRGDVEGADAVRRRVAFYVAGVMGELLRSDYILLVVSQTISCFPGHPQGCSKPPYQTP